MMLINKEKLIHDYWTAIRRFPGEISNGIEFWIAKVIEEQESIINLRGNFRFGSIVAPCPHCGSFSVEISIWKETNKDNKLPHYRGRFHCLKCEKVYDVIAEEQFKIFQKWNESFIQNQKGVF